MGTCDERKAPMGRELERYLLVGGFGIGKSAETLGLTLHALEQAVQLFRVHPQASSAVYTTVCFPLRFLFV